MADQTPPSTFIPKKAPAPGVLSRSGGLISFLANIIFVIAVVASVTVFAYDKYLESQIAKMNDDLTAARAALEPELINKLVDADNRLIAANQIIKSHITLSTLFELLQKLTLQNVRFSSFSFGADPTGNGLTIGMKGEARTYATVALQEQIFGQNDNFINPGFSNLDLNDVGNVIFSFRSNIKPDLVSYLNSLGGANPALPPSQVSNSQASSTTATSTPSTSSVTASSTKTSPKP